MKFPKQLLSVCLVASAFLLMTSFSKSNDNYSLNEEKIVNDDLIEIVIPTKYKSNETYNPLEKDSYKVDEMFLQEINGKISVTYDNKGKVLLIKAPKSLDANFFVDYEKRTSLDPEEFEACAEDCGGLFCKIICAIRHL